MQNQSPSKYREKSRRDRQTGTTLLIDLHYQQRGHGAWSCERVFRLCRMMNCTLYELGAMACIESDRMDYCVKENRWSRSESLHFALFEQCFFALKSGLNGKSLVPFHLFPGFLFEGGDGI